MQPVTMELTAVVSRDFGENSYIANLPGRADCLVIDPGLEPEPILEHLDRRRLAPAAILNTHGHADHIAGNAALKRRWPACPLIIGRGDASKLTDAVGNLSASLGMPITSPPADRLVDDGERLSLAGFELEVLAIPGHTPGHVVYLCRDLLPGVVFVGDVIMAGSVGRTDFPGGSTRELFEGIRRKLFKLPDDTRLLSGHGPETTVGEEKRENPFVGQGR